MIVLIVEAVAFQTSMVATNRDWQMDVVASNEYERQRLAEGLVLSNATISSSGTSVTLTFTNMGSIVAYVDHIWFINSTIHKSFPLNSLPVAPGPPVTPPPLVFGTYIDPSGTYCFKAVTTRGNTAQICYPLSSGSTNTNGTTTSTTIGTTSYTTVSTTSSTTSYTTVSTTSSTTSYTTVSTTTGTTVSTTSYTTVSTTSSTTSSTTNYTTVSTTSSTTNYTTVSTTSSTTNYTTVSTTSSTTNYTTVSTTSYTTVSTTSRTTSYTTVSTTSYTTVSTTSSTTSYTTVSTTSSTTSYTTSYTTISTTINNNSPAMISGTLMVAYQGTDNSASDSCHKETPTVLTGISGLQTGSSLSFLNPWLTSTVLKDASQGSTTMYYLVNATNTMSTSIVASAGTIDLTWYSQNHVTGTLFGVYYGGKFYTPTSAPSITPGSQFYAIYKINDVELSLPSWSVFFVGSAAITNNAEGATYYSAQLAIDGLWVKSSC
jgi:hypothetical protein